MAAIDTEAELTTDLMSVTPGILGAHLPLVDLSGGIMIFQDGSLGAGFSCTAPMSSLLPNGTRQAIYDGLRAIFTKSLPDDVNIQVVFGQESRVRNLEHITHVLKAKRPLIKQALVDRTKAQLDAVARGEIRVTTLEFYVTIPPVVSTRDTTRRAKMVDTALRERAVAGKKGVAAQASGFWTSVSSKMSAFLFPMPSTIILSMEEYIEGRAKLLSVVEVLSTGLEQAGLSPVPMGRDQIKLAYYRRNNPQKYEAGLNPHPSNDDSLLPIGEEVIASPFQWSPSGKKVPKGMFFLDGYYHQILTLTEAPELMHFPHWEMINMMRGLNRMEMVVNISPASTRKRIQKLQDQLKNIEKNKNDPTEARKYEALNLELESLGAGMERLWNAQHVIVLRDRDSELVSRISKEFIIAAQGANGAEVSEELEYVFGYWMASQPGWCRDQDTNRHNFYNTRQLAAVLPVSGGYRIKPKARIGAVFETADNSLINIFLHDNQEFPNPNFIVAGKPGSGKSVLVNCLMTQLARHDPLITMVDIGGSYRRLCDSMGGNFLEYNLNTTQCRINIFDVFAGRTADQQEFESVMMVLEKMVYDPKVDTVGSLSRAQRTTLEDALQALIRKNKGNAFFLKDLRQFLNGQSNEHAEDLAMRLMPFCENGSYAALFDGPTTIAKNARFTVFELQKVKNTQPQLLPLIFQTVIQHITALSTRFRQDLQVVAMDEAHVLLKDPLLLNFVELAYRTFRKLGVATIGISQGVDDWLLKGSNNEKAILQNVSGIFACQQVPAAVEATAKIFDLSPNETAALGDLQFNPGVVSEFMAIRFTTSGTIGMNRKADICCNRLTPIEYAMYTTDADDLGVINRWLSMGTTMSDATMRFAQKYPRGVRLAGGVATEDQG